MVIEVDIDVSLLHTGGQTSIKFCNISKESILMHIAHGRSKSGSRPALTLGCAALMLAMLAGCGEKEKKPGQALASVNGDEITVMQLNEELARSGVQAGQQDVASKRLLEGLIDRQLLVAEAAKEKLDRDPKVVQAIERARALIIAQAYLQKKVGTPAKPGANEVSDYFTQNPMFFANRKQLNMRQIVLPTAALDDKVKAVIDGAKTLDEVAAWLESNHIKFGRNQVSRSSAELPPELTSKLLAMKPGQLFIVREGERSLLISISDIKDAPVTLEQATPQIEQFLINRNGKNVADAELKRLRAAAKIEYLGKEAGKAPAAPAPAPAPAPDPAAVPAAPAVPAASAAPASAGDAAANERGVAGLK
jgi:EpsD family peptidyl-prolyl cis-trans isomerase